MSILDNIETISEGVDDIIKDSIIGFIKKYCRRNMYFEHLDECYLDISGPDNNGLYIVHAGCSIYYPAQLQMDPKNLFTSDMNPMTLTNNKFRWGNVFGDFDCCDLNIQSLKDGPEYVYGNFRCMSSSIISLEGAPGKVGGNFDCSHCINLKTLKGAPKVVCGKFYCNNCMCLTSIENIKDKSYYKEQRYGVAGCKRLDISDWPVEEKQLYYSHFKN